MAIVARTGEVCGRPATQDDQMCGLHSPLRIHSRRHGRPSLSEYQEPSSTRRRVSRLMHISVSPNRDLSPREYVETCSICLQDMRQINTIETACGHLFHQRCLLSWMDSGFALRCPICRVIIRENELIHPATPDRAQPQQALAEITVPDHQVPTEITVPDHQVPTEITVPDHQVLTEITDQNASIRISIETLESVIRNVVEQVMTNYFD